MILGALGWLMNLGFAGSLRGNVAVVVAVAQAHDPGASYLASDPGAAFAAHDAGASHESHETGAVFIGHDAGARYEAAD